MTVLVACSAKGSPGVTTTVLALALGWPRPVVVVCADPGGDDLRGGLLQAPTPAQIGLLELALAARRGTGDIAAHAVALGADEGSVWLIPGVSDPAQSQTVGALWPQLTATLSGCGRDVLVDVGRLMPGGPPPALVALADTVAVVLRPTLAAVDRARPALATLEVSADRDGLASRAGLLCVGDRPYRPAEVATALDGALLGVLPYDPESAARLADGEIRRRRPLLRAAAGLARDLAGVDSAPGASAAMPGGPVGVGAS